jgi:hypothetical protein
MEKPEVFIDYNSGMGGVDISDAYSTSYRSTRKRLKKYYKKYLHHLIDVCYLNSCLLYKKRWKHFQDGIPSEIYRKFNFEITGETIRQTMRNCPANKNECCSLSLLHCCHSIKTKSMSVLCYILQKGSML